MLYGSVEEQQPSRTAHLKRQAVASILAVCAVTLMAASYAGLHAGQYRGNAVDLMEVNPINVPYLSASMLAQLPNRWNDNQMANMQQLAQEKTAVGNKLAKDMRKLWSANSNPAKEQDVAKVQTLRNRFESILNAMNNAPVLRSFQGPNGEMRAVGNGRVFQLYPYHVPGNYEDVPLDLDQDVPIFEKNPAGSPANFQDPVDRNPIYQGEYPAYAARQYPMLRNNQPMMLEPMNGAQSEYYVVADNAGQLRLLSPEAVQGMVPADGNALAEQQEWKAHAGGLMSRMRREVSESRNTRRAASSTQQLAAMPEELGKVAGQAWNSQSLQVRGHLAARKKAPIHKQRRMRKDPMLTDSGTHSYGTVYEPYLDARLNPAAGDEITNLRGAAKGYYKHYDHLASRLLNVKDPASDSVAGADWWTGPEAKENWWQHDHSARGY